MGSKKQKLTAVLLALTAGLMAGCSALRPTELTFAGGDVMLRGIEPVTTHVEYYDEGSQSVKVKKARIDPPFWIVNEEYLKSGK